MGWEASGEADRRGGGRGARGARLGRAPGLPSAPRPAARMGALDGAGRACAGARRRSARPGGDEEKGLRGSDPGGAPCPIPAPPRPGPRLRAVPRCAARQCAPGSCAGGATAAAAGARGDAPTLRQRERGCEAHSPSATVSLLNSASIWVGAMVAIVSALAEGRDRGAGWREAMGTGGFLPPGLRAPRRTCAGGKALACSGHCNLRRRPPRRRGNDSGVRRPKGASGAPALTRPQPSPNCTPSDCIRQQTPGWAAGHGARGSRAGAHLKSS